MSELIILATAVILVALVGIVLYRKHNAKSSDAVEDYYANLSADEILSKLKTAGFSADEPVALDTSLKTQRIADTYKDDLAALDKKLSGFIAMQGSLTNALMDTQKAHGQTAEEMRADLARFMREQQSQLNAAQETAARKQQGSVELIGTRLAQLQKQIDQLGNSVKEARMPTDTNTDHLTREQEILSERISNLNEHLQTQKKFFEDKAQNIDNHDFRMATLEKDLSVLQATLRDLQSYAQTNAPGARHPAVPGSDVPMKEFTDLINEKMANFFEERKNQLQKIEIHLQELQNLDSVKQNILLRLQKEFSERLSDMSQRFNELKNYLTDQMMSSEDTKKQLLELEKAIQNLNQHLQLKQNELFQKEDLRLQTLEDRFMKLTSALDQREESTGKKDLIRHIEQHERQIDLVQHDIDKVKQFIADQQLPTAKEPVEKQLNDLKNMVYSLINTLKE
jgi:DNA repair exonuclease SbcCD ATPase subunit